MSERRIGKVISVDSFRVVIQLDDNLKSLLKSGFNDIYEIARINSYIIIPVGSDLIVGLITRVKIQDEAELDNSRGAIILPKADRYLVATMIGTIESFEEERNYLQGIYNFPILENPVWYVTKDDLDKIFDSKANNTEIDYEKDYFLPIGESPAFKDYQIKINPDKFFGKHAAILGNTGSGKSCSVATIIQSLFEFEYNNKNKLKSSHIIIFDTNGEYKRALIGDEDKYVYKNKDLVNCFHIDKEGLKVPYWFMNYDDFEYLFEPSSGTQAPILKRAISLARNKYFSENENSIPQYFLNVLINLQNFCECDDKKNINNFVYYDLENSKEFFKSKNFDYDVSEINIILNEFPSPHGLIENKGWINGNISQNVIYSVSSKLKLEIQNINLFLSGKKKIVDKNIDIPSWFEFKKLIEVFIDEAINESEFSGNKVKEYISTLRLRLQSFYNDQRLSEPLLLKKQEDNGISLSKFISFIIGDFCKVNESKIVNEFSTYYDKTVTKENDSPNQVTIIDLSLLPFEVLETITALIGRLILEFLYRIDEKKRGEYPVVLVLEEAQNYIPEKDKGDILSISKKVFERIAREGRKFGLSLLISSQRPAEVSKTVLSQCNSYIIHRLQNPEDQRYIRQLVSSATEDILQQLPVLPQQHAIILGDGVRTPVQVKMKSANPTPDSNNPKIIENWLKEPDKNFPEYEKITDVWIHGEKVITDNEKSESNIPTSIEDENKSNELTEDEDLPF